jgi:hypothetical protein
MIAFAINPTPPTASNVGLGWISLDSGSDTPQFIPMSFQKETKVRRILGRWQGASEAHTRSGLERASNAASGPKDQRICLSLRAIWN